MCFELRDRVTGAAGASQPLQKSSNSVSPPCRELSSRKMGLVEDYEQQRVEDSFSKKTNDLNVCRPELRV